MFTWFRIEFVDGSFGFQKMSDEMMCVGVFHDDGTPVGLDEKVEYTCIDMNAPAPAWA